MDVRVVDQPEQLAGLLHEIDGVPLVALDTEAASFHRYHDRIYLVQLSTPTITAVIDPLGVGDLSGIGALRADNQVEKVFHDADYDLRLFDKEFGFHARNVVVGLSLDAFGGPAERLPHELRRHRCGGHAAIPRLNRDARAASENVVQV